MSGQKMGSRTESSYTLVLVNGALEKTYQKGLSLLTAMGLVEELRRDHTLIRVLHERAAE